MFVYHSLVLPSWETNAIQRPSGDHLGSMSSPFCRTSGAGFPPLAEITNRSELKLSGMSGVGCVAIARRLPSGENEKPVTCTSPLVSCVALRVWTSITHSRFHGYIMLGVQASSLSFSCFLRSSLLGSRERYAIAFPSGDHWNSETPPLASERRVASPPSGRMSQIWRLPSSAPGLSLAPASSFLAPGRGRSERNAIVLPSGDQRGFSSRT